MKAKERKLVRKLRSKGWSPRTIATKVGCAKSSASNWIKDIPLTEDQIKQLKSNQDIGRAKSANHPNSPKKKWEGIRAKAIQAALEEMPYRYSLRELKYVGAALYWAEGDNLSKNAFVFSNSNPAMIKIMRNFLDKICKIPLSKFRGKVQIHPHLNAEKARQYWSRISGIPTTQFHKTSISVSRASKRKRDTLPLGTFNIVISDVILCSKIKGWIEGLKRLGGWRSW
jgi:hypothetical protein